MKKWSLLMVFFVLVNVTRSAEIKAISAGGSKGGDNAFNGSERHISIVRDIVQISYPDTIQVTTPVVTSGTSPSHPKRMLMTKPETFGQDGLYIWRDSEGIWNILPISSKGFVFTADLTAINGIKVFEAQKTLFSVSTDGEAHLNYRTMAAQSFAPFQIKATGPYVEFNLTVNGKHEPTHIYLGRQSWNPLTIPFRLENRPLVAEHEPVVQAITNEQPAFRLSTSNTSLVSNTNLPSAVKASGGGGGAPGL